MKLLLLFAFNVYSFLAFSQSTGNNNDVQKNYELLKKFKQGETYKIDSVPDKFNQYFRHYEFDMDLTLQKNNVVTLPDDNMPCIVPDTNSIAAIPNAWRNVKPLYRSPDQPMPNPGLPPDSFRYRRSDNWTYPVPQKKK